ncbi:nucleotidyltransferase [Tardiphaga alba]|uniref:Nucleotidyltransferase n=1 Tax=Tardiphaga alba TaxID=340268 RepID=A0ABX8A746_9BRAD|nr:nucleotidyltransferase [Tardiphaga alba]QUS38846.1 nucleotidyltransferase [Tardiphaga alba]
MPLTVEDAFEAFLVTLTTSRQETQSAASHRASVEAKLKADFELITMFRTGSFGAATNIRGYSDVDYFAVIPTKNLKANSASTLTAVAASMRSRFPNTANIRVSGPGVQIPFGDEGAERVEIIPVDATGQTKLGFRQFDMPDENGGWKFSAPESHKEWVDSLDRKLDGKLKPLIRLVKAWKFYRNVPIRSFYLEMRTAELMRNESVIIYDIDLKNVLKTLWNDQLAGVPDPRFPDDQFVLSACSSVTSRADALSKLSNAATWSDQAAQEKNAGKPAAAIAKLNLLYADRFPKFGLL